MTVCISNFSSSRLLFDNATSFSLDVNFDVFATHFMKQKPSTSRKFYVQRYMQREAVIKDLMKSQGSANINDKSTELISHSIQGIEDEVEFTRTNMSGICTKVYLKMFILRLDILLSPHEDMENSLKRVFDKFNMDKHFAWIERRK